MRQDTLTLWIVSASASNAGFVQMCHVYAHDEEEARERVAPWLRLYKHLTHHEFRMCPNGFIVNRRELPGSISFDVWDG